VGSHGDGPVLERDVDLHARRHSAGDLTGTEGNAPGGSQWRTLEQREHLRQRTTRGRVDADAGPGGPGTLRCDHGTHELEAFDVAARDAQLPAVPGEGPDAGNPRHRRHALEPAHVEPGEPEASAPGTEREGGIALARDRAGDVHVRTPDAAARYVGRDPPARRGGDINRPPALEDARRQAT